MTRIELMDWAAARAQAAAIRETVFVQEQGVPVAIEMDDMDAKCLHALAFDGGRAVATGRLLPDGHVGRMAVLRDWRGKGIGSALLQRLVDAARRRGDAEVLLSAQVQALPFYRTHGFVERGAIYLEAGIEHRDMALDPARALLAEAALRSAPLSDRHCTPLPSGDHCGRVHGAWPALKLMRLVGSPAADGAFYAAAAAEALRGRRSARVLVSGASDHGLLEQVLLAAGGTPLDLTVLDRCETPLLLNAWYAERAGWKIASRLSDILDYAGDAPFDLIFAHCFVEQLPAERWPALAAKWYELLAPGGRALVVSRVRSPEEIEQDRTKARPRDDLRAALERENLSLAPVLHLPVAETAARIERFWKGRSPLFLHSEDELARLLQGAGFAVDRGGEGYAESAGRAAFTRSRRARLVAIRR